MVRWIPAGASKKPRAQAAVFAVMLSVAVVNVASGQAQFNPQARFDSGQDIATVFEGWEENPDGSFNMVFGYLNRNWKEEIDVPIGPDNNIEPGGPDQGQPTHFYPRRNRMVFRVRVPKDWGKKDLVWTLTVRGSTVRAYGSLIPGYALELGMTQEGGGSSRQTANEAPVVRLEGEKHRTVKIGESLSLNAFVSDDGVPQPRPAPPDIPGRERGDSTARGLRVAWHAYRGPAAKVKFAPMQFKVHMMETGNSPWVPGWTPPPLPADGKHPVRVTFDAPGTYVIQLLAHDGSLKAEQNVTVTVTP